MNVLVVLDINVDYVDILKAIKEALLFLNANVSPCETYHGVPYTQQQTLMKSNEWADLIIADLSGANVNVMYVLGFFALAKKPVILIGRNDDDNIPFDIAQRRNLIYDRIRLQETLVNPLENLLKEHDIREFIPEANEKKKEIKTIFISYSHKDVEFLDRLKVHIRPFEKTGLIDLWVDTNIKAGEKWKEKIDSALDKSAIAILLISADFLASDFIIDNELPQLLKKAAEKGKYILPVILKPCRFLKDHHLSQFQAINDPSMPLSKMNENEREEVYANIADHIEGLIRS